MKSLMGVESGWSARFERYVAWFPFGRAPLLILAVAVVTGAWMLFNPVERREATLRLWTFAETHYYAYLNARPSFEAEHPGVTVDMQFVHAQAVTSRLRAAFWSDLDVPDAVEVEISSAGSFFRGRPEHVGFVDLLPRLRQEGLLERMVATRFAPYTYRDPRTGRDHVFGLPHDVHPVMLAYRRDLFEELGIDASKLETWDDFIRAGRRVTVRGERYMIALPVSGYGGIEMCLFQRYGLDGVPAGYFDPDGRVIMDNEVAVETMMWYVPLVAGPEMIAKDPGWGQPWVKAVEDGYILSFVCPDWRSKGTEQQVPRMRGKMGLMPLPAVRPGGRRTSSWGGTMLGITRASKEPELAWALAKHLYLNPEELAERFRDTNILPALKDAWEHEAIHEPRGYWSGQRIGRLYAELAEQVPPQYSSPYIETAKHKMAEALSACARYWEDQGEDGFEAFVRARLKQGADEVRRLMKRDEVQ